LEELKMQHLKLKHNQSPLSLGLRDSNDELISKKPKIISHDDTPNSGIFRPHLRKPSP